jgi:uncharacterized protein YndB with AHSA1/START domain
MMLQKTVVTDKPLARVFDYLSDFTSTTDWDPGTVTTVRQQGDGGVGSAGRTRRSSPWTPSPSGRLERGPR